MLARRSRPQAGVPDPAQGPRAAAGGQHERALRGPRELRLRVHRLRSAEGTSSSQKNGDSAERLAPDTRVGATWAGRFSLTYSSRVTLPRECTERAGSCVLIVPETPEIRRNFAWGAFVKYAWKAESMTGGATWDNGEISKNISLYGNSSIRKKNCNPSAGSNSSTVHFILSLCNGGA